MTIYLVGSVAYDRIMSFSGRFSDHILPDKIHMLNVSFIIHALIERFGGTAGNIAYTLSLLEETPTIIASVGSDFAPYEKHLRKHQISQEGILISTDLLTASAYIMTDQSNCQITGFNPGASVLFSDFMLPLEENQNNLMVISPTDTKEMMYYARLAKKKKMMCLFDPGQQIPALSKEELIEVISTSDILISNDYEIALICEKTGFVKEKLCDHIPLVITTLGEHGCDVQNSQQKYHIPAFPVQQVVDPTGAGDAFRSGLIKGMLMGKNIIDAARMGIVAASYVVEQEGTQEHLFTQDGFWQRYHYFFQK